MPTPATAPEESESAARGPSAEEHATDAAGNRPAGTGQGRRHRPVFLGLFVGVTTFGWALTPSLLPRPWIFEGVIAGIGAALGYGVGVALSWGIRKTPLKEPPQKWKRRAWIFLAIWAPALAVLQLIA